MKYRFCNNVRLYRKKCGFNQTQLANIVAVSRNTISSIENYQFSPTAYLAGLLCQALDVKFEQLFYYREDMEK